MSEYPIPEDLEELYRKAKNFNAGIAYAIGHLPEQVAQLDKLIERIAKQDAEILEWKDRLRQITECRDDLNRLVASKDEEIERLKQTLARFQSDEPELGDLSFREQLRSALITNLLVENERLENVLQQIESGIKLMVPEPQKSGFLNIIAARAAKEKPCTDKSS